jgi:hypothetical protein
MRLAAITLAVVALLGVASSSARADHGWDYSLGQVTTVGHYGHPGYRGGLYRYYDYGAAPVIVVPLVPPPVVHRVLPPVVYPPVYGRYGYGGYRHGRDFDFHYRGRNFGFSFGF